MDYADLSALDLALACCDATNEDAWIEFYRRYHRNMTAVASSIASSHNQHSVFLHDEIVQEIYVRIFRNDYRYLRNFRPRSEEEAEVLLRDLAAKTTRTFFRDARRKKRFEGTRIDGVDLDDMDVPLSGSEAEEDLNQRILVQDLLKRLSCTLRSSKNGQRDELVFRLRFREGLSIREIAELPDVRLSVRGVEGSIRRSISRLRTIFAAK